VLEAATRIAIELAHAVYDCVYLDVAIEDECRFVTSDGRFMRNVRLARRGRYRDRIIGLAKAADQA
jgi:predicted nucleic acid-binding protein